MSSMRLAWVGACVRVGSGVECTGLAISMSFPSPEALSAEQCADAPTIARVVLDTHGLMHARTNALTHIHTHARIILHPHVLRRSFVSCCLQEFLVDQGDKSVTMMFHNGQRTGYVKLACDSGGSDPTAGTYACDSPKTEPQLYVFPSPFVDSDV